MKKSIIYWGSLFFLFIALFFLNSFKSPAFKNAPSPVQQNIVIIFMDDMGYGDPECYGGGPYHTPNINQLAASGMRFTNFYVAQAVCSARGRVVTRTTESLIRLSPVLRYLIFMRPVRKCHTPVPNAMKPGV